MTNAKFQIKLSIVIVYFGGFRSLINLLSSIKKNKVKSSYEIIVVNNKLDEKIESNLKKKYKDIVYIESSGNIGYGRGNNLGAKLAQGKYLFILNPDTKIVGGSIDKLVDYLQRHKGAGVIAPNLVDTKGKLFGKQGTRTLTPLKAIFSLSILSRLIPNNKLFREYYMLDVDKKYFREVDVAPGSALMIRSNVFENLGGFDKNFFLFFEEMDLCKRVKSMGMKIFMTPNLILEHDWSSDGGGSELKKIFSQSRFYYFQKHYGVLSALIVEFFARLSRRNLLVFPLISALIILGFLLWI